MYLDLQSATYMNCQQKVPASHPGLLQEPLNPQQSSEFLAQAAIRGTVRNLKSLKHPQDLISHLFVRTQKFSHY